MVGTTKPRACFARLSSRAKLLRPRNLKETESKEFARDIMSETIPWRSEKFDSPSTADTSCLESDSKIMFVNPNDHACSMASRNASPSATRDEITKEIDLL